MQLFRKLFSNGSHKPSSEEFQHKKTRLERLSRYYQDKINYLSSPKIPPSLAAIACRDVPLNITNRTQISGHQHIKMCLKYYKKRLSEIGRELKKIL